MLDKDKGIFGISVCLLRLNLRLLWPACVLEAPKANSSPSPKTRFQAGLSGNPAGSSRRAKSVGEVARVPNIELMEFGADLLRVSVSHLEAVIGDPDASVLQR